MKIKPGTVERQRTIAIAGCSYSHVIQCRDWLPDEVGAIAWFAFDNPGESPKIPTFSGVLSFPSTLLYGSAPIQNRCGHMVFPRSKQACDVNWSKRKALIQPSIQEFEDKAFAEIRCCGKESSRIDEGGKK